MSTSSNMKCRRRCRNFKSIIMMMMMIMVGSLTSTTTTTTTTTATISSSMHHYQFRLIPLLSSVSSILVSTLMNSIPIIPCFAYKNQVIKQQQSYRVFISQQNHHQQQQFLKSSLPFSLSSSSSSLLTSRTKIMVLYDIPPSNNNSNNYNEKFGWKQRFASIQCFIIGAISGSISFAPISLLHNIIISSSNNNNDINTLGQWEYDTDMAAIIAGLFAIIYRYVIRDTDRTNPQLKQGYISSMIVIRTVPQIHIPTYCTAIPLNCNHLPFLNIYIFDYNILQQLIWYGLESTILFTITAMVLDMAMEKGYIIRFPG